MQTKGVPTNNSVAYTLMLFECLFLNIRLKWSALSSPVNVHIETASH